MNITVYNQSGEKTGTARLAAEVFGIEPKNELIHRVVVATRANLRKSLAHTKNRGEVRGGGKKPWRQKGTGRARAGSIRSPLWRGGGIIFGPRNEKNYQQKINKKIRRQTLLMALSDKAAHDRIFILEDLKIENKKTKEFAQIIKKLPFFNKKSLILYQPKEKFISRIAKNITNLKILSLENLNLMDVLNHEYLVLTKETLKTLEAKFKK